MIIVYIVAACIFFIGTVIHLSDYNNDYVSQKQTRIINGFFVFTIFISHFKGYIDTSNILDNTIVRLTWTIDQLMVTTFFFYSGYGILESIKNKKDYIKLFPKKRLLPLWFNLLIGDVLFLIMNIVLHINYSIKDIVLSLVGYTSIGNSNWFIFITFILYIFTIIAFSIFDTKENIKWSVCIVSILSIILVGVLGVFKPYYFVNTLLCFPLGMLFSLFKLEIETIVKKHYVLFFVVSLISFVLLFLIRKKYGIGNNYYYNILSCSFVIFIVICSMKFSFNNKLFEFFGQHVFWIYVLQRIPMICLKGKIDNNYLYFITCFIITIVMSYVMNKFSKFVLQNIDKPLKYSGFKSR